MSKKLGSIVIFCCSVIMGLFADLMILYYISFHRVLYVPFLMKRYLAEYHPEIRLGMSEASLEEAITKVLLFMKGLSEEGDFTVSFLDGSTLQFLNSKEIFHLEEVWRLIHKGQHLLLGLGIFSAVFLVTFGVACFMSRKAAEPKQAAASFPVLGARSLAKGLIFSKILLAAILAGVGIYAASDFHHFVIVAHQLFFDGDHWLLSYSTDRLLSLCPEGILLEGVVWVGAGLVLGILIQIGISIFILRKTKKIK